MSAATNCELCNSLSKVDRRQTIAHFAGSVTNFVVRRRDTGRVASQLMISIRTPTHNCVVVTNYTSEVISSSDHLCCTTSSNIYDWQRVTHFVRAISTGVHIAEAQLAVGICTPTLHGTRWNRTTTNDGTCKVEAGRDCSGSNSGAKGNRRQSVAHFTGLITAMTCVAEA
jgi:hypothetical protein